MRCTFGKSDEKGGIFTGLLGLAPKNGRIAHGLGTVNLRALAEGARELVLFVPLAILFGVEILLQNHDLVAQTEELGAEIVVLLGGIGAIAADHDLGGVGQNAAHTCHGFLLTLFQRIDVEEDFPCIDFGLIFRQHAAELIGFEGGRLLVVLRLAGTTVLRVFDGRLVVEQGIVELLELVDEPPLRINERIHVGLLLDRLQLGLHGLILLLIAGETAQPTLCNRLGRLLALFCHFFKSSFLRQGACLNLG